MVPLWLSPPHHVVGVSCCLINAYKPRLMLHVSRCELTHLMACRAFAVVMDKMLLNEPFAVFFNPLDGALFSKMGAEHALKQI